MIPMLLREACSLLYNLLMTLACLISSYIIATDTAPEAGQLATWTWASHFPSQNVNTLPNLLSVQLHQGNQISLPILLQRWHAQTYCKHLLGYIVGRAAIPVSKLYQKTWNFKLWEELPRSFSMRERSNNVTANCYCNSFIHKNYLYCTSKFSKTLGYQPNKCHFSQLLLPGASFNLHRQLFSCLKFYCKFCIHKSCSPCLHCLPSYDIPPPLGC